MLRRSFSIARSSSLTSGSLSENASTLNVCHELSSATSLNRAISAFLVSFVAEDEIAFEITEARLTAGKCDCLDLVDRPGKLVGRFRGQEP